MLLQETKDYVNDVLLPKFVNEYGYDSPYYVVARVFDIIGLAVDNNSLLLLSRIGFNIRNNREEFTDYVVKSFQDLEAEK
ncbi:MAG: hypothetical protein LKJ60_04555 [Lentilactobacillus buchneri]|jgi:hypothetical protein|nr:hypothetical protein [Lentilactobacillus buchneri]